MYNRKEDVERICPLGDLVKVEIIVPKEIRTEGGILLPGGKKTAKYFESIETYEGKVLAIGPEAPGKIKDKIRDGDIVVFDRLAGHGVPTIGDKYIKLVPVTSIIMKRNKGGGFHPGKCEALHERAIIKMETGENITESGIYLGKARTSSHVDSDTLAGEVIHAAEGVSLVTGDKVRVDAFAGVEFESGNEKYKVVSMYDILAKV